MENFEYVLTESDAIDVVRMINGLIAKHKDTHDLAGIDLFSVHGQTKGRIYFNAKEKEVA